MDERKTWEQVVRGTYEYFSRPGAKLAFEQRYNADEDEIGICVYRGDYDATSPIRCAFGVHIPDDRYDPRMEGVSAGALIDGCPASGTTLPPLRDLFAPDATIAKLEYLQGLHDDIARSFEGTPEEAVQEFLTTLESEAKQWGIALP